MSEWSVSAWMNIQKRARRLFINETDKTSLDLFLFSFNLEYGLFSFTTSFCNFEFAMPKRCLNVYLHCLSVADIRTPEGLNFK